MTRQEAEGNLIRKPCIHCKTTKYLDYRISFIGIINNKRIRSSELWCKKCHSVIGAVNWDSEEASDERNTQQGKSIRSENFA